MAMNATRAATRMARTSLLSLAVLSLAPATAAVAAPGPPAEAPTQTGPADVPGGEELKHLIPDIKAACAMVVANPAAWPYRSFPYGPLGLEVRKAGAEEAARIRAFHLGLTAAACKVPLDQVTAAFDCGPDCPNNRRDHLIHQLHDLRAAVASFEKVSALRILSIWLPREELRVNDVYVLAGQVREAIPSPKYGLVPSGSWKPWKSLDAYLASLHVAPEAVSDLSEAMYGAGLSAMIREKSGTRVVGVGVGDNESGLLFLQAGGAAPKTGEVRKNGSRYTIVQPVAPGVWYYETS